MKKSSILSSEEKIATELNWFESRYQFTPPPGFVDVDGPTYQRIAGLVRYVP